MCSVDDCTKPPRSKGSALCPMHYHRQYRHGSTTTVANEDAPSVHNGRRYRRVRARAGHPLADRYGRAYDHRLVLFDAIGPGEHACHYCGTEVRWDRPKAAPDALTVDHLNDIGDDNRPENLVPSCGPCNSAKGSARRHAALVAAGWWSANDTIARLRRGGRSRRAALVATS